MDLIKAIQDLETIMKPQRETTQDIKYLEKKSGAMDPSISNRIQESEERISDAEDTIESIDRTVKEKEKCKSS